MMQYESPVNQDTTCPPNIDYNGYKVLEVYYGYTISELGSYLIKGRVI